MALVEDLEHQLKGTNLYRTQGADAVHCLDIVDAAAILLPDAPTGAWVTNPWPMKPELCCQDV